ncbi:C-C motif chemokine 14 [Astyanax mexicanus]|uniref:C-C motif chemokine 14 n=1 Tax=Astyanax mexicanus TaxID=7994 RepID=UPI0020CB257D|nr:C-C motif chemokine 14 [Astyanax mexicanus]
MKMSSVWCLALGLVLLTVSCGAEPHGIGHPDQCCFKYTTVKIPPKQIDKVEKTSLQCPMPAFVVTTAAGRKFCVQEFPKI